MSAEKVRWPHGEALAVAEELVERLRPYCERILICGSLRRKKPTVGDVEIVYVSRWAPGRVATDMFAAALPINLVDECLEVLLLGQVIGKRVNAKGSRMWGPKNKYGRHLPTGIPVDFFEAQESSWWNYVVCRTGGEKNNTRIAGLAKQIGWKWHPYGTGFERSSGPDRGRFHVVSSEREVFDFVRVPYLEPEERL